MTNQGWELDKDDKLRLGTRQRSQIKDGNLTKMTNKGWEPDKDDKLG